MLEINLIS